MTLSILIPTLPEPQSRIYLQRITNILKSQIKNHDVQLVIDDAPRNVPTGQKRNAMVQRATGDYIVSIDCDDTVPMYYLDEIFKALQFNPDVVTFCGHMLTDGKNRKNFVIKLGEKYEERNGVYYRFPNHLTVMKKSLVQHVKFRHVWVQEDYHWAREIHEKQLLKNEIHLPIDMYCYDFQTVKKR